MCESEWTKLDTKLKWKELVEYVMKVRTVRVRGIGPNNGGWV